MTSRWPLLIPLCALLAIAFLPDTGPAIDPYAPAPEATEPEPGIEAPRRPRPRSRRASRAVGYTEADLPDYVRAPLRGATRLQRRLEVGLRFRRLERELASRKIAPRSAAAALLHLAHHRLHAEGRFEPDERLRDEAQPVPGAQRLLEMLAPLTNPALDPRALPLYGAAPGADGLGADRLVRLWAQDRGGVTQASLETGISLVKRLDRLAGVSLESGYDVVNDPSCGRDLFRGLRVPGNWIGIYLHRDRFCLVDATLPPARWSLVLRHELVHAWQYAHCEPWSSRFLTEGIAEYLRHVRPGDPSIEVPLRRLRDNFALLLRMVERFQKLGKGMDGFSLQRLLTAQPWEFYMLGYFSYLVAQASIAYVDVETLKRSLWSGRESALWTAIHALEWKELIAWVREQAGGGVAARAFVVGDSGQERPIVDHDAHRPKWAHRVLSRMGVDVSPSEALDALELGDDELIDSYEHVGRVMAEVLGRGREEPLTLICDVTSAMDVRRGPVTALPESAGNVMPALPKEHTPRRFLESFLTGYYRHRRRGREVHLMAASDRVEPARHPLPHVDAPLHADAIPAFLRHGEPLAGPVIVLTASAADAREAEAARVAALTAALRPLPEGVGPYLVVDLGSRPGYGRDLARALYHAGRAAGVRVAYWHAAEAE